MGSYHREEGVKLQCFNVRTEEVLIAQRVK